MGFYMVSPLINFIDSLQTVLMFDANRNEGGSTQARNCHNHPFIPGGLKNDSLRDRLFFNLYSAGKIDSFAICKESETWDQPELFQELELQKISEFLDRDISISCTNENGEKFCCTITLRSLLKHLNTLTPGNIYLIGSHLQEIANSFGWVLNNIKKLVDAPSELYKDMLQIKASDSDWRIFPDFIIPKQTILNLSNGVVNFFAEALFKDELNQQKKYDKLPCVKRSSFLKFNFYSSQKDNAKPSTESTTTYTTVAFGQENGMPIDLMFIEELKNPYLFPLDDFKLNMTHLVNPSLKTCANKFIPENNSQTNIWQQITDQALYILHSPDLKSCDEMGFFRALRHLTKGGRFFENGLDIKLFEKINPSILSEITFKYFDKINPQDTIGLIALYFQLLSFLYRQKIDKIIIFQIQEKLSPLFKKKKVDGFWLALLNFIQNPHIPFHVVNSAILICSFLHMSTSLKKVVITRNGFVPVFEFTDNYSLQLSGSILEAIETLKNFLSSSTHTDCILLKEFLPFCFPEKSYEAVVNESLQMRIHLFGIDYSYDSKKLMSLYRELLDSPFVELQQIGYHILIATYPYFEDKEALLTIFRKFPLIECGKLEKFQYILGGIQNILSKAHLLTLFPVFLEYLQIKNRTNSEFLNLLIRHMNFSSYELVYQIWLIIPLEAQTKASCTLAMLDKIKAYDVCLSILLLDTLMTTSSINVNFRDFFSNYCKLLQKINKLESLLQLKKLAVFLFSSEEENNLQALEQEFIILTQKLDESGLQIDAEHLFSLIFDRLELTGPLIALSKKYSNPLQSLQKSKILSYNLKQQIEQSRQSEAITSYTALLNTTDDQVGANELRDLFRKLFKILKPSHYQCLLPIYSHPVFQSLYSSEFESFTLYLTSYMEFKEDPGLTTLQMLTLLLSNLDSSLCLEQTLCTRLFGCLLRYVNLSIPISLSFAKLVEEKALLIMNLLTKHLETHLMLDLLIAFDISKIQFVVDDKAISYIVDMAFVELNNERNPERVYQLLSSLKLFKQHYSSHTKKIEEVHNLLLKRLVAANLSGAAKQMVGSLIASKEPNEENFFTWMELFVNQNCRLDIYLHMTEKLLHHVNDIPNENLLAKIDYLLKSTAYLVEFSKDGPLFKLQQLTLIVEKLTKTANFAYFILAIQLLLTTIDDEITKRIIYEKFEDKIENLLILIVKESIKFTKQDYKNLSSLFCLLIYSLITKFENSSNQLYMFNFVDSLLKCPLHFMHIIAGQVLFVFYSSLKKEIPLPLVKHTKTFINLIISNKIYFTEELRHIGEFPTENLLFSYVELPGFDNYFENSLKAQLVGKLLIMKLSNLQNSNDYNIIEPILLRIIKYTPFLKDYPAIEYECMDLAFNVLINLLGTDKQKVVDLYLVNLLRGVTGKCVISAQNDFELDNIDNPERFFEFILLFTQKLMKTTFLDVNGEACMNVIQRCLLVLLDVFDKIKNKQIKISESTDQLELRKKQFTDIFKTIMYCPAARYGGLFINDTFNQTFESAVKLGVFEHDPQLKNKLDFYLSLDPLDLLRGPGGVIPAALMNEVLVVIKQMLSMNSQIMLLRAINIFKVTQHIQRFNTLDKSLILYPVDPKQLALMFHEIRQSILHESNYNFDLSDFYNNKEFKHREGRYIFGYFQMCLIENPNILTILHSAPWKAFFVDISAAWCETLIKLYAKNKDNNMKGVIFVALSNYIVSCSYLNCFHNSKKYSQLLTTCMGLFHERIAFLNREAIIFKKFLDSYDVGLLFNMKNPNYNRDFKNIALKMLNKLSMISHPSICGYIEKQTKILLKSNVLIQKEVIDLMKHYQTIQANRQKITR
jgi:hypothetical protein